MLTSAKETITTEYNYFNEREGRGKVGTGLFSRW